MTDDRTGEHEGRKRTEPREPEWQRRRRLAEIFGDVLPESTSDDRDPSTSTRSESASDAWLRGQVPPHHGG